MPKRTLSESTTNSLRQELTQNVTDSILDVGVEQPLDEAIVSSPSGTEHVAKFYRLSTSPDRSSLAKGSETLSLSQEDSFLPTTTTGTTAASVTARLPKKIQCLLPPHQPLTFPSLSAFESHLLSQHSNRCASCGANFPSTHLLELHGTELHDPLAAARRDRGEKIFACLVPHCDKVCSNRWKRRRHVIDKHGWRKDYDWAIVERGIDGKGSALTTRNKAKGKGGDTRNVKAASGRDESLRREMRSSEPTKIEDESGSQSQPQFQDPYEDEVEPTQNIVVTNTSTSTPRRLGESAVSNLESPEHRILDRDQGEDKNEESPKAKAEAEAKVDAEVESKSRQSDAVSKSVSTNMNVAALTSQLSALSFIPPSVRRSTAKIRSSAREREGRDERMDE